MHQQSHPAWTRPSRPCVSWLQPTNSSQQHITSSSPSFFNYNYNNHSNSSTPSADSFRTSPLTTDGLMTTPGQLIRWLVDLSPAERTELMTGARTTAAVTSVEAAQQAVAARISTMWAQSTWDQRHHLVHRFDAFRRHHTLLSEKQLDWAICLFTEQQQRLAASTRLTYATTLAAVFRRITGSSLPITAMYVSSLRANGALIPLHQAEPATPEVVNSLLVAALRTSPRLMAALFIIFKTASRTDDVLRLTRRSFVQCSAHRIIIAWLDHTKATRADPFRASSWTVVEHDQSMESIANIINSLNENERLLETSTSEFTSWLQRQQHRGQPLDWLSGHSFKRGALTWLVQAAAAGLPIDISKLPLLAKHKTEQDFCANTLRYLSNNQAQVALMLGTQHLTRHIPCLLPGEAPPQRRTAQELEAEQAQHQQQQQQQLIHDLNNMHDPLDDVPVVLRQEMLDSLLPATPARRARTAPAAAATHLVAQQAGATIRERVAAKNWQRRASGTSAVRRA